MKTDPNLVNPHHEELFGKIVERNKLYADACKASQDAVSLLSKAAEAPGGAESLLKARDSLLAFKQAMEKVAEGIDLHIRTIKDQDNMPQWFPKREPVKIPDLGVRKPSKR